jgi:hypothetical protein
MRLMRSRRRGVWDSATQHDGPRRAEAMRTRVVRGGDPKQVLQALQQELGADLERSWLMPNQEKPVAAVLMTRKGVLAKDRSSQGGAQAGRGGQPAGADVPH